MNGDEPGLSDRAKYLGNPNYVTEFVGPTKLDLIITFDDPSNNTRDRRWRRNALTVLDGHHELSIFKAKQPVESFAALCVPRAQDYP